MNAIQSFLPIIYKENDALLGAEKAYPSRGDFPLFSAKVFGAGLGLYCILITVL